MKDVALSAVIMLPFPAFKLKSLNVKSDELGGKFLTCIDDAFTSGELIAVLSEQIAFKGETRVIAHTAMTANFILMLLALCD